jgi:hypothetical protein
MRKTMEALSDRLLSMFVAKADVAAACAPDPWYVHCYCTERSDYRKRCQYTASCGSTCGACYVFSTCGS